MLDNVKITIKLRNDDLKVDIQWNDVEKLGHVTGLIATGDILMTILGRLKEVMEPVELAQVHGIIGQAVHNQHEELGINDNEDMPIVQPLDGIAHLASLYNNDNGDDMDMEMHEHHG